MSQSGGRGAKNLAHDIIVGPGNPRDGEDFATTFKRIFFTRDDEGQPTALRLVPLNRAHPERQVTLEEVTGIYPLLYRLVPRRTTKAPGIKPSERIKK